MFLISLVHSLTRIRYGLTALSVLLISLHSVLARSHGGGLDSLGCHNDRSKGSYHCHRKQDNQEQSSTDSKCDLDQMRYSRERYGFQSYKSTKLTGFYTGVECRTSIDHVVSLKDAHVSGAGCWTDAEKSKFANDRLNHVDACANVNSAKSSSVPADFLRKSSDGRGIDYQIKTLCAYLGIYYQVKEKYRLSFENNQPRLFAQCGLNVTATRGD